MSASVRLKTALASTTALIAITMMPSPAHAIPCNGTTTISTATTASVNMCAGADLTVTGAGSISNTNPAVSVSGVTAHNISNSGTVKGTATGILVNSSGAVSGTVTNSGTISGAQWGVWIRTGNIAGAVNNSGLIHGNGFAGFMVNGTLSGNLTNTAAGTISALFDGLFVQVGTVSGTVSNNGLIHGASFAGIDIQKTSTVSGAITNGGTISGGRYGIDVRTNSVLSGGIANNAGGTIHGATTGISVFNSGTISGAINNSGSITGAFVGISVVSAAVTGAITNNAGGVISGSGEGFLLRNGGDISGAITNRGTISGNRAIFVGGSSSDISGGIVNSAGGNIVGGTAGIYVSGGKGGPGDISGGIVNSGTISGFRGIGVRQADISGGIVNNAGGTISGNRAIDIQGSGDISGGIVNRAGGTISGTTDGINLSGGKGGSASLSGDVDNSGTISGGAFGISVFGSSISGLVQNRAGGVISGGTVGIYLTGGKFGSTDISGGIQNSGTIVGLLGISVGSSSAISGSITNEPGGVIHGTGGTAILLQNVGSPTPIILNGGSIIGDVVDSNAAGANNSPVTVGGDFSTGGNFTVSDLTVTAGNDLTVSSGDVFTTSRMTTPSTGALTFAINNAGAGKLAVNNGNAINLSVATLAARITGAPPVSGTEVMIGDGAAALIGPSGPGYAPTVLASSSAMWQFTAYDGTFATAPTNNTDLFLVATQVGTVNGLSTTASNATIGTVIEGQAGGPDPQLSAIADNLNNAQTQGDVNDVESSAGPTLDESDVAGAFAVDDETLGLTDQHLAFLRTGEGDAMTGMAAGNIPHGVGMWGQFFGRHADQDDRDGVAGYTSDTWGGAVGVDTHNIGDHNVLGLAFSYGHTDANSDNANDTDTDVDSYQLTLYGSREFPQGYYLNGEAAYSWDSVDRDRHNVGGITGLTAHGDYDASMWALRAEGGRDFRQNGMTLTPNLTANWMSWDPDSYTETGAGGANLRVDGDTLNRFELGVGVKAGWSLKGAQGSLIKPMLRLGYRYALVNDKVEDTAQFTGGGGAFRIEGADPGRSTLDLGASVKLITARNWDFTGSYDFNWKSDYTSHAGFLRVAYRF